ncbi:hypothetical protein V1525DRAFT_400668 [Lipomyces kononenkoae]|uniref:Uncharacterized protein n=1 Tax=Lipomyces kononenkoae TaxID=34357 RepID=A0ACC3T412_LIPKO
MVGVAGGSRGCANCKKRKLKCDETFPVCLRCIKSGLICSGPVTGPMYRKQRLATYGQTYVSSVVSMSATSASHDPDSIRPGNRFVDGESQINFGTNNSDPRLYPVSSADRRPPSGTLHNATASRGIPRRLMPFPEFDVYQHCLKLFVERHLITGHPSRFGALLPNASTWVEMLPQLVLTNEPSSTTFASRALVFSHYSSMHRDPDFGVIGANWYIEALKYQKELIKLINAGKPGHLCQTTHSSQCDVDDTLSADGPQASSFQGLAQWACTDTPAIRNKPTKNSILLPENASAPLVLPVGRSHFSVSNMRGNMMSYEDDSITAGLLLTIYEVFNCTTETSWKNMLAGACELMRVRGPHAYRTGFNFVLFQSLRGFLAFLSMAVLRNSFLNSPEWKTVPWLDIPSGKTIQHELVDLVLEVPQHLEVAERVFINAFVKDEVSPIPINYRKTALPRLRSDYNTQEVWALLRQTHLKLRDLECRFETWFKQYFDDAQAYAHTELHLPPSVTFDSVTAAPNIPQPRCPATASDTEYASTHFFKPAINYVTVHDARAIIAYCATRMAIAYLQQLTARFAYGEFEDSTAPSPRECNPEVDAYIKSKARYLENLSRVTCRSWDYVRVHSSNIAVLNILYPLRVAHSVIKDTLELGWIWNELHRIDNMGIRVSLADLWGPYAAEYMSEWKAFMSLEVCQGCGEHIRPLRN